MIDFGFLLIGFLNYTLHKSNCQAKLAELITLKVVEILLIICYDLTSIDSKYIIFMGPCMSSLAAQTIFTPEEYLALERKAMKCYRLFRPQFSKVKTSFLLEIREVSNTLTPSGGVFGDTPV